jgi:hypothetical protein
MGEIPSGSTKTVKRLSLIECGHAQGVKTHTPWECPAEITSLDGIA